MANSNTLIRPVLLARISLVTHYTYPISMEKEDGQYYAYSEDLPGVYGLGDSLVN
jgi:hypothetical protein